MQYSFELEGGNFSKAGYASSQIKKVLKQLSIDSRIIKRIVVALYEAEVNIVAHAWRGKVSATLDAEKITLLLKDEGPRHSGYSASHAGRLFDRFACCAGNGIRCGNGTSQYEEECRRTNNRERGRRGDDRTHGYLVRDKGIKRYGEDQVLSCPEDR